MTDDQIEDIWANLDGLDIIKGKNAHEYNKAVRIAFARAILKTSKPIPKTPEDVVAFIGSNFDKARYEGKMEDWKYQLSVHDLLSAFQWWSD